MTARIAIMVLGYSIMLTSCTSAPAAPPTASLARRVVQINNVPPEKPHDATVILDDPSLVRAVPDNEPYGPTTFYTDGDTTTVFDVLTHKLITYRSGKRTGTIGPLPDVCLDLIIQNGHYWTLVRHKDDTYAVIENQHSPRATQLTPLNTYAAPQDQPMWLSTQGPNMVVQGMDGQVQLVAGAGPLIPPPTLTKGTHSFTIDDGDLQVQLVTPHDPPTTDVLARAGSYTYYWVSDSQDPARNHGWVYQLATDGSLVHTYTLVLPGDLISHREVQIAPDGQVYEMVVTKRSARVYRIAPNP